MMVTNSEIKRLFRKIKENGTIDDEDKNISIITENIELKDSTLGSQIAYYRRLKGLRQEDLANEVNVTRGIILLYEKNKEYRQLNKRTMNIYRRIFKVLEIEDKIELHGYEKFIFTGQAKNLKKLCKKTGFTKDDIAKISQMPYGTVVNWCRDRVNMSKNKYEKLERELSKKGYSLVE